MGRPVSVEGAAIMLFIPMVLCAFLIVAASRGPSSSIQMPDTIIIVLCLLSAAAGVIAFLGRYREVALIAAAVVLFGFTVAFLINNALAYDRLIILIIMMSSAFVLVAGLCLSTPSAVGFDGSVGSSVTGSVELNTTAKTKLRKIQYEDGTFIGMASPSSSGDYCPSLNGELFSDDYVYVGEWRNNVKHGDGTELKDGLIYHGHWNDGKKNGWFKIERDGLTLEAGRYVDDLKEGIWISPNGTKTKWSNGQKV